MRMALRWLLGIFFIVAGVGHFLAPGFYVSIMPPYLPWHLELVYLSGLAEVLLGLLALIPRSASLAGWGLVALLIAVFPANLHMAMHPDDFRSFTPLVLWLRLPLQALFILWAYWSTRPRP